MDNFCVRMDDERVSRVKPHMIFKKILLLILQNPCEDLTRNTRSSLKSTQKYPYGNNTRQK